MIGLEIMLGDREDAKRYYIEIHKWRDTYGNIKDTGWRGYSKTKR